MGLAAHIQMSFIWSYFKPGAEFSRFSSTLSVPCACCNAKELSILSKAEAASEDQHWIYTVKVANRCGRCNEDYSWQDLFERAFMWCLMHYMLQFIDLPFGISLPFSRLLLWACFYMLYIRKKKRAVWVKIPINVKTVGTVERAIHAASIASKGAEFRAHGTFIHHLSLMDENEVHKQALCAWAPTAMMSFMQGMNGVSRKLSDGHPVVCAEPSETTSTHEGNPDLQGGDMPGTKLNGDEYGEDDRIKCQEAIAEPDKILGFRIGPDLIPAEVMAGTEKNLKAGLSKRVRPLPFKADKNHVRKIERTVTALIKHVFSEEKIKAWREENPQFDEFKSKKWSSDRWRNAVEQTLSDTHAKIEQEFQIKTNETLPAKGKAPRPLIQCGDKAQVMMQLPVKCFEELLFEHFEEASIKHVSKYDAMQRVAERLRQNVNCTIVEGDGSAWDACCNKTIRSMTENRIMQHIIATLGDDPEVPKGWMDAVLADMKKEKLKGKANVEGKKYVPAIRIVIDSIRQSGHRGTSCFNYLINLVCWLCVLADNPEDLIKKMEHKTDSGKKTYLPTAYISAKDGEMYRLKYAFEGDDSVLSTTEKLDSEYVEKIWKSFGFRMKLVFVEDKMTFTGFDFLCDNRGPVGCFIPEVPRNIASSSWSNSNLLKQQHQQNGHLPRKYRHDIGMAAFYARAESFKDCGPLCNYFAHIGLAHAKRCSDRGIEEAEACFLGVNSTNSIVSQLQSLVAGACVMDKNTRTLIQRVIPDWTQDYEISLLTCDFGADPMDTDKARMLLPKSLWDPANYDKARR